MGRSGSSRCLVWDELIGVPLDRNSALGTRNVLTDEEFEARRIRLLESASPDNIEATNFGAESELAATRSRQASLVVDPPDGRRPPRTSAAEARQPARNSFLAGPFDSVADLGTYDRCIAFSTVPAAAPAMGCTLCRGRATSPYAPKSSTRCALFRSMAAHT